MQLRTIVLISALALLTGCATDTGGITTSAFDLKPSAPAPAVAAAPKVDPACVALMSQIESIRKEGVVDRVQKVVDKNHKAQNLSVRRVSLAKLTELDKANAEFQAKCSTISPMPGQAQAAPAAPVPGAVNTAATNKAATAASGTLVPKL